MLKGSAGTTVALDNGWNLVDSGSFSEIVKDNAFIYDENSHNYVLTDEPKYGKAVWLYYMNHRYILVVNNGSGSGAVLAGSIVTAEAEEKEGMSFKEWSADGIELTSEQKKSTPVSFGMPANDVTLTAEYALNSYDLT
ncbi:MAG: hypothetical protein J6X55_10735, partial [Victivallales bacterium]|nr:hypothetical protein [Victivallales bacterium]